MNITVAKPEQCPMRVFIDSAAMWSCKVMLGSACITPMTFPDFCPLRSRTIVIERADVGNDAFLEEVLNGSEEEPSWPEVEVVSEGAGGGGE